VDFPGTISLCVSHYTVQTVAYKSNSYVFMYDIRLTLLCAIKINGTSTSIEHLKVEALHECV